MSERKKIQLFYIVATVVIAGGVALQLDSLQTIWYQLSLGLSLIISAIPLAITCLLAYFSKPGRMSSYWTGLLASGGLAIISTIMTRAAVRLSTTTVDLDLTQLSQVFAFGWGMWSILLVWYVLMLNFAQRKG